MKFGYRDRIILLIVCVVVIFLIGIFAFIRPKYQDMTKDEKALQQAQTDWDLQLVEFDKIESKQKFIERKYNEAKEISLKFTDEMDATKLDQFLQEKFFNTDENKKNGTKLNGNLAVSDEGTAAIGYYYFTPSIVTYPLYEYADLDKSLAEAAKKKREEADTLAARPAQIVGAGTAGFTVTINKADAFKFIDGVREYAQKNSDAMLLTSVTIKDYDFNGPALERDEDGKITGTRPENLKEKWEDIDDDKLGYTDVTVSYNVYYMQEPMKPDVGDKYDKTVWDGDAWRNYTAESAAQ